jgi:hypothetical protein
VIVIRCLAGRIRAGLVAVYIAISGVLQFARQSAQMKTPLGIRLEFFIDYHPSGYGLLAMETQLKMDFGQFLICFNACSVKPVKDQRRLSRSDANVLFRKWAPTTLSACLLHCVLGFHDQLRLPSNHIYVNHKSFQGSLP